MDLATIIGLVVGFILILVALFLGGTPGAFFNLPSVLIVIFGTLAITTICFSLREMMGAPGVIARTMFNHLADPGDAAYVVMRYAEHARKEGILGLQKGLESAAGEKFLVTALTMVIDGTPGDEVERILRSEVEATAARHMKSANILRKAAEIAPAMGLIGTLIGLVQMLGNLDDPAAIGPNMAVALITTFYGAVLANMVFAPLAAKLERNSREEALVFNVYLTAAASIARRENPRRLELLLNAMLPPSQRVSMFD